MAKSNYYTFNNGLFTFGETEQADAFVECYNRVSQFEGMPKPEPNYKGETTRLQGVYFHFPKGGDINELQLWLNSSEKEHGVAFRQTKGDKKRVFTKTLVKSLNLAFDESKRVKNQNSDRVFVPFDKLDVVLDTLKARFTAFAVANANAEQANAEQANAEQANAEHGAA